MSNTSTSVVSFADFRSECKKKYTGNKNKNKTFLHDEFSKITKDTYDFDDYVIKAFKLAQESTKSVGEAFAQNDRNDNFQAELKKGNGHWEKAAALHYYLLVNYPGHGKNVSDYVFGAEEVDDIIDATSAVKPVTSSSSTKTAPFNWPPHVSEEDAFAKSAHEGVWLNPHNHFSIPLSGREVERKLLDNFVSQGRHFLIGALIAPSGAGKTRLISEWMRAYMAKYQDNGWDAGFVASHDESLWYEENWNPAKNTLIIIDYTYNYDQVMGAIIDRFKDQSSHKIRLLLLDHILPDNRHTDIAWEHSFSDQGILDSANSLFFKPFPIVLKPETDQSVLLRDVIACAADPYSKKKRYNRDSEIVVRAAEALMKIGASADEDPAEDQTRRRGSIRHPLFAALIGQTLHRNAEEKFLDWSRRDLITHYFEREQRIPWEGNGQNKYADILGPWIGCYVSAATLLRGVDVQHMHDRLPEAIQSRLSEDNLFPPLVQYCNRIVSSNNEAIIKPFEPDILGEAFLLIFIGRYANDKVLAAFAVMLGIFSSPELEEKAATAFLETLQRLVRNLINDDQKIKAVEKSWAALSRFLNPECFPENSLMRQAISISLGDTIKQCRAAGLNELIPQFAKQIKFKDLCDASSSVLWKQSAIGAVHYFDWLGFEDRLDERHLEGLAQILKHFKERSETKWPALMLAAYEGALYTAKSVQQFFDDDVNSSQNEGSTILMVSVPQGDIHMVDWLISQGANPNKTQMENGATALMHASWAGHGAVVERLIDANANVDQRTTDNGATSLMLACFAGHVAVVERLIKAGAKVDQRRTDNGATALMAASFAGHVAIVKHLIEADAMVDQRMTSNGATALMVASEAGHLAVVERLIEANATVDQGRTDTGATALMTASSAGHLPIVERLIEAGATVNQRTSDNGATALIYACRAGYQAVAERLIEADAVVDQGTTDNGATGLIFASEAGHLAVVERLIEAKATVDQGRIDTGATALMTASFAGHKPIVERLIEAGAKVHQRTTDIGTTALIIASEAGYKDVVERLIEANAPVDQARTDNGVTALMTASFAGYLTIVERLIEADAMIDQARTDNGATALMIASEAGHLAVVERLIEANATVDQGRTDNGATALMTASFVGHVPIVKGLIEAEANVDQRTTDNGATALIFASEAGHRAVAECLIAAKATVNLGRTDNGITALIIASFAGHAPVVELLIEADVNVDLGTTDEGATALFYASQAGYLAVVVRLIEAKATVDQGRTDNDATALMAASEAGHMDIIECLIKNGADVNAVQRDGATALMFAYKNKQKLAAKSLILSGANVSPIHSRILKYWYDIIRRKIATLSLSKFLFRD